jgi:CRISPR system Cascade subunit CasA
MFLTQLAAIALRRGRCSDPRLSEEEWRGLLLSLTADRHEPWSLVVEELSDAAFLQSPVPEATISGWQVCYSPDDIDVLVTAKGHDVKGGLIHGDELESWTYALVTLQTTQGYPGRGYYGIARMKGGYGNRPRISLSRDHTLEAQFLRDVAVLLEAWESLLERGYSKDGAALVWTRPWNGRTSLAMHELAPHFIEVCWRVRLQTQPSRSGVRCLYTTTKARRCLPEIENGDVGDPWIPVERTGKGALTVGPNGIDYRLMTKLLFGGDFAPAATQRPRREDGASILFIAAALARGQGKTEGLHERALVLAGQVRQMLGKPDQREALGKRAAARVVSAAMMRSKVLYPSLKELALGGTVAPDRLDGHVDEIFFDHLFRTLGLSDDEARLAFDRQLRDLAKQELEEAIARASIPDARRLKAISLAERRFASCLRRNFPDITSTSVTHGSLQA